MSKGLTLEEYISKKARKKGWYKSLQETYSEWVNNKITLIDPSPPKDFLQYLFRPAYSLWLWNTILLVILTIILIELTSIFFYVIYLRYVLGTVFVLYLPGAMLIEALYPKDNELSPLERLALSIGLSLAIVPLIGLILNYSPWGIRLEPVMFSIALFTLSMCIIASWRKYDYLKIIYINIQQE